MHRVIRTAAVCSFLAVVAACGGGSSEVLPATGEPSPTVTVPRTGALSLEGLAADATLVGEPWAYHVTASYPDGAEVRYRIENKPAWASFDTATGMLSGTPRNGDLGETKGIRIVASSSGTEAQLSFDLKVVATATGRATLSWDRPTAREDGSSMTNLAGYRIYYGKTPKRLDRQIEITDPQSTHAELERLTPGTWYFAAAAFDRGGWESAASSIGSKTIG